MDALKREQTDFALRAGGWLGVPTLIWVFQSVFLGEPQRELLGFVLLAGGIYLFFKARRSTVWPGSRKAHWIAGLSMVALAIWASKPPPPEALMKWQPFTEAAVAQAAADKKPVIIDFYADWCGPCVVVDRGTFSKKRVVDAAERFVRLRVDLSKQEGAAPDPTSARYGVSVLPTIILIGSDGKERHLMRVHGVEGPNEFVTRLNAVQ